MPQLEQIDTFLSQIFWLVVTFGFLYIVLWKAALPRVSTILLERQERIDEDLRKAEELKKEADEALAAYEKTIAYARSEAPALLLTDRIKADIAEAEARIDQARSEAVANIQTVAAEVAQAATARLIGAELPAAEVEAAVADAMRERS